MDLMNEFVMAAIGFLAGACAGAFVVWVLMKDRGSRFRIAQENSTLKKEMSDYREQVDQHFVRTAELVNTMTQAYRAVHQELASSAQALCSEETQRMAVVHRTLPELPDEPVDTGDSTAASDPEEMPSDHANVPKDKRQPAPSGATAGDEAGAMDAGSEADDDVTPPPSVAEQASKEPAP